MSSEDRSSIDRRTFVALGTAVFSTAAGGAAAFGATASTKTDQTDYTSSDSFFGQAYIDRDEERQVPTLHRYVHGGFRGTDTRFSFYFPPAERYENRFFQVLEGGLGGNENSVAASSPQGVVPVASLNPIFELGGYLVESNQGHIGADLSGAKGDATIITHRASAETAKFGKFLAARIYGREPRYGYVFGGSGGGIRSLLCLENTKGIWQGGAPFIIPHPSQGMFFSLQANTIRLLGQDNIARVADAMTVGGSGRPFDGLNAEQARALATLYKAGFPRGISLKDAFEAVLVWSWNAFMIEQDDPTYYADFYSKPGYVGHDDPESLTPWRVSHRTRVRKVLTAQELQAYHPGVKVTDQLGIGEQSRIFAGRGTPGRAVALLIEGGDLGMMGCAQLDFKTGAGRGRPLYVLGVAGDALVVSGVGNEWLEGVKPGDEALIDNSRYLAYCHRWMHQIQPEFAEWGPSLLEGQPLYPQRPRKQSIWAGDYSFDLTGKKVIIVNGLQDRGTWPSSPVAYRTHLERKMGVEADEVTRIWFNEQQQHIDGSWMVPVGAPVPTTEFIDYGGSIHEALRQVVPWVEQGKAPAPSSRFVYTADAAVLLEPTAAKRGGVQPKVAITANGVSSRVQVKAGEPVSFAALAESIPGGGPIVAVEWDYEGLAKWTDQKGGIPAGARRVDHRTTHTYMTPGTYFPACRTTAQHAGSQSSPFFRLNNIGRMRVVVT